MVSSADKSLNHLVAQGTFKENILEVFSPVFPDHFMAFLAKLCNVMRR